jgi:hypothetical protein
VVEKGLNGNKPPREDDFMQAIKAIYDGVGFTPKQPIPVQGQYEVVILFVEQIALDAENERIKSDIEFWREYKKLLADSHDEILSLDNFPRTKFNREFIVFEDEEQTL